MSLVNVFVSAGTGDFASTRQRVHAELKSQNVNAVIQEALVSFGDTTLNKINSNVDSTFAVFQLIGPNPGSDAPKAMAEDTLKRTYKLLAQMKKMKFAGPSATTHEPPQLPYTHWEGCMAVNHGIPLYIYTWNEAPIGPVQDEYLKKLQSLGRREVGKFSTDEDLFKMVRRDLVSAFVERERRKRRSFRFRLGILGAILFTSLLLLALNAWHILQTQASSDATTRKLDGMTHVITRLTDKSERLLERGEYSKNEELRRIEELSPSAPSNIGPFNPELLTKVKALMAARKYGEILELTSGTLRPELAVLEGDAAVVLFHESGSQELKRRALDAFDRAVRGLDRKQMPLDWAIAAGKKGALLAENGRYAEAEALMTTALENADNVFASRPQARAAILRDRGGLLHGRGDFRAAADDMRRAAEIYSDARASGAKIAETLRLLGDILMDEAIEVRARSLARDDLELTKRADGQLGEAKRLLLQALELDLKKGAETLAVAADRANLGYILFELGEIREAEVQMLKGYEIRKSLPLKNNPDIGFSLESLVELYRYTKRPDKVQFYLKELADFENSSRSGAD